MIDDNFIPYSPEALQPGENSSLLLQVQYSKLCSSIAIELYSQKASSDFHQAASSIGRLHESLIEWKNKLPSQYQDFDKAHSDTSMNSDCDCDQYASLFSQFHTAIFAIHRYWETQAFEIAPNIEVEARTRSRSICLSSARACLGMSMQSHQSYISSSRQEPSIRRV